MFNDLIKIGLDEIEVYNSLHALHDIKRYLKIAKEYNLLINGGSDIYWSLIKPNVKLGFISQEKINIKKLSLVEHLKQRGKKKDINVLINKKSIGNVLFSHTLSSELKCLTSVFGMGTGVSTSLKSPIQLYKRNNSLKTW